MLKQIISNDIIAAYYYQVGSMENSLRYDKQMKEACRLLNSPDEYKAVLVKGAVKKK